MLKIKTTQDRQWSPILRSRVGDSVIYDSQTWVNRTGANDEPGVGFDWEKVGGGGDLSYIIPFGTLIVFKNSTNIDNTLIEAGDSAMGQLNGDLFLNRGTYTGGDPLDINNYNNAKYFDPN